MTACAACPYLELKVQTGPHLFQTTFKMTSQQHRAEPELCFYGKQLQLALPQKQNVCRLKHIKGATEHYLLRRNTTCEFSGQSPL